MISKILPKNEHVIARALRITLGLLLLSLVAFGPQTLWGLLGIVPLLTGLVGSCPVYTLFGFGTCSIDKNSPATMPR